MGHFVSETLLENTNKQGATDSHKYGGGRSCLMYRNFNVFVETHCVRLKIAVRLKKVDTIETHAMRLYSNIYIERLACEI